MKESAKYHTTSKALTSNRVNLDAIDQIRINPTDKERFENWFIAPLKKLDGDDSIICLMIIMPILEKILRYDLDIPAEQDLTLSENSPALKRLAKHLSIPASDARMFWDCFRNGLMHRAMIKGNIDYILDPAKTATRAAVAEGDIIRVYVWKLRDLVLELLSARGKQMWKDGTHPLPDVH
jgi:hypothetical protein